jgi:hypothetical protein
MPVSKGEKLMNLSRSPWLAAPLSALALAVLAFQTTHADDRDRPEADRAVTVRGRVTRVRPAEGEFSLRTRKGEEVRLFVDARSTVQLGDRAAGLDQLREGMRVRVTYEPHDRGNRVLTVATPAGGEVVRRRVREWLGGARGYGFEQRQQFGQKLDAVMRDLDEELENLQDQAEDAGPGARRRYEETIEELRRKREAVRERLARLRSVSGPAWEDVRNGINAAVDDLEQALERARARFR